MKTALTFALFVLLAAFLFNRFKIDREAKKQPLKYWPFVKKLWNKNDNLRTHKRVLDRLGLQRVNGSEDDSWDVMWSIEYPYPEFPEKMMHLKPHQRVNHFPGIYFVINKATMSTQNHFPFIPVSFRFPAMRDKFLKFVASHPDTKFVVKKDSNRGVKIVSVDEVNMETTNENVYQEFIENPLLIDDRLFDMGVYVLISSIDPLRVYRFKGEVLVRFCPEPYYPFNSSDVNKYVIFETHKIITEMPALMDYYTKLGFSMKKSVEENLRSRGYNVSDLWNRVDEVSI